MEYTITDFRIGDFEDQNGNTWCRATFKEFGEPCIWVVKNPESTPERFTLGTTAYGEIKDWKSSKGRTSPRFYAKQRPDAEVPKSDFSPKKDFQRDITPLALDVWRGIKDQWDIRSIHTDPAEAADLYAAVMFHTNELTNIIENVRNSGSADAVSSKMSATPTIKEPAEQAAATGYSKAKATRASLDFPGDEDYPGEPDEEV